MATFKLANQSFVFLMIGAASVSILMLISPGYAEGFDDSDELLGNDYSKDFYEWMRKLEEVMEDNKRMKDDMDAMQKQIADIDAMKEQISKIESMENKINEYEKLINETRYAIKDENNKPRFVAVKRSGGCLQSGDITFSTSDVLIDVGDHFTESTGVYKVGSGPEDEGTYIFSYSGHKGGDKEEQASIRVYQNEQEVVQYNYFSLENPYIDTINLDNFRYLQMNAMVSLKLKAKDTIKLYNGYGDSIFVDGEHPFTFIGYKV